MLIPSTPSVVYTPNISCSGGLGNGNPDVTYHLNSVVDYFPYGKVLREYVPGNIDERFLTTYHERDHFTGLDYRGARFYDSDVGRFLSLDPLAVDYPALSDYVYVAGNPVMFIDPTGKSVDDIYIDTDGNYLGEDGDTDNNTIRVVNGSTWNAIENGVGASSAIGTAALQHANFSTPLVGVSETKPGYQKGISISEATWGSIESAGGQRATARLTNDSNSDAYFRGDGDKAFGPGSLGGAGKEAGRAKYNPQIIKPGEEVFGGVDGVKTDLYSNAIFKISDGNSGTIQPGGDVTTQSTNPATGFEQWRSGGWQDRSSEKQSGAFKTLQDQPIGKGNFKSNSWF